MLGRVEDKRPAARNVQCTYSGHFSGHSTFNEQYAGQLIRPGRSNLQFIALCVKRQYLGRVVTAAGKKLLASATLQMQSHNTITIQLEHIVGQCKANDRMLVIQSCLNFKSPLTFVCTLAICRKKPSRSLERSGNRRK